jgi:hypothetical protein
MDDANQQLLSRDTTGVMRVWDVRTHRCVQVVDYPSPLTPTPNP